MVRIEIRKAILNKFFAFSVIIGCAITMLSLVYNIDVYQRHLYMLEELSKTTSVIENPVPEMFSLFNHWIGGEPLSLGSSMYFFVFPLLVAIPYGWSYCEEKNNGYNRIIVVQSGAKTYLLSKYIAVFLSGAVAMVVPLLFNFILTAMFFPAVTPVVIYDTAYGVFGNSLMSMFYYTVPFLYVFLYICIDFVFCGFISCISFSLSSFVKYKSVVVILPLFIFLILHYTRQFVYTSYGITYKEISPLYFLRPVRAAYDASWSVVLIEMAVIFFVTFTITMVWERKHEIY